MKLSHLIEILQTDLELAGDGEVRDGDSFTTGQLLLIVLPTDLETRCPALDYVADPVSCQERTALNDSHARLLVELEQTADWLDERAEILERLSDGVPLGESSSARGQRRQAMRDEAARFRGRAMLIRDLFSKENQNRPGPLPDEKGPVPDAAH